MVSAYYSKIKRCRACNSKQLDPLFSLGSLHISAFPKPDEPDSPKAPLNLVKCKECNQVQLLHTVSRELIYSDYWYKSGVNQTMRDHLANVTKAVTSQVSVDHRIVVDIGCSDGTLLRSYDAYNIMTVGFEPALNLFREARQDNDIIVPDFFSATKYWRNVSKHAHAITAIAMFYDLEDPNKFLQDVKEILHKDGIFVVQQNYLIDILMNTCFDHIDHEHLLYHNVASMYRLLTRNGLRVADIEFNYINGGSFRLYIKHEESTRDKQARPIELWHPNPRIYELFVQETNHIKQTLRRFVLQEYEKGKKIFAYGASNRGNTILQYCGLGKSVIAGAADRNPAKWGRETVGTRIPIMSEDEARKQRPDYFLVLPYSFLEEFLKREEVFLLQGGRFIVPVPQPRLISHGGHETELGS